MWAWLSTTPPAVVIGSLLVVLGWFATKTIDWKIARRLRDEKTKDFEESLYSEIRAHVAVLERDSLDEFGALAMEHMENDETYIPLIPQESNDTIFKSLVSDIHILPRRTLDSIVVYYSQLRAIELFISDLRSDDYGKLSKKRQIAMYRDYIEMKKVARDLGLSALRIMENG